MTCLVSLRSTDMKAPSADGIDIPIDDGEPCPISGVRIGAELGNKFRINHLLGQGGMGYVVHATHLHLDEPMALKFLRREVLAIPGIVERFIHEARAASKLKSEHSVRVFDVGFTEDQLPYMVMEYLDGSDLAEVLHTRGALPMEEAVGCVIDACSALAEAHDLGIVHRDVKPENLFLSVRSGRPARIKILDFGISKFGLFGDSLRGDLPGVQGTMGSPWYMSPEQLESAREVDSRADIWSLGVVLYELLSNDLPFDRALPFAELSAAIQTAAPRPLTAVAPHLPHGLQSVILRCLEKDAALRFQCTADLARALHPFAPANLDDSPPSAPAGQTDSAPSVPAGQAESAPSVPAPVPARSSPFVLELTQLLARHVGPFARVLVQKELRALGASAIDLTPVLVADLALRLATKIPTAIDRRLFLDEATDLVRRRLVG